MNNPPENKRRNPDKETAKSNYDQIWKKPMDWLVWFFGLLDTHNGVVTAFGTLIIAIFTVVLALATIELKKLGEKQAADTQASLIISRDSATAAKQSAEVSEKALVAANRPWIKVDIQVGGPIVYNVNGANFTLNYIIKNVGHSPATNVWVSPRLVYSYASKEPRLEYMNPRDEMHKDIAALKMRPPSPFGFALFPGDSIIQPMTVTMSNEDIKKATELIGAIYPVIIGAVDYRMSFDGNAHDTGFIVEIRRNDAPRPDTTAKNRYPAAIWVDEGDVPASEVRLFRSFIDGGYAD